MDYDKEEVCESTDWTVDVARFLTEIPVRMGIVSSTLRPWNTASP
jgi:hypothetical protein